ncbi:MAG: hypothetical protein ACR2OA_17365 [Rubripirellula sp.]
MSLRKKSGTNFGDGGGSDGKEEAVEQGSDSTGNKSGVRYARNSGQATGR